MKHKTLDRQDGESAIAKMVMDRIRREDPWAFSQADQIFHISMRTVRWLTALGLVLLTMSLVLLLAGLNGSFGNHVDSNAHSHIIGVGEIGYAEYNPASQSISLNDMVASIGDVFMISGDQGSKSINFPLLISVFIFFEVLLLMNWITRNSKP